MLSGVEVREIYSRLKPTLSADPHCCDKFKAVECYVYKSVYEEIVHIPGWTDMDEAERQIQWDALDYQMSEDTVLKDEKLLSTLGTIGVIAAVLAYEGDVAQIDLQEKLRDIKETATFGAEMLGVGPSLKSASVYSIVSSYFAR